MSLRTYYLICDPATGLVARKTHGQVATEVHFHQIPVIKAIWKSYRAGDLVSIGDIPEPWLSRWRQARARACRGPIL